MIAWLSGRIIDKSVPGRLVLDVGGVGYDVETSLATFFHLEEIVSVIALYIHTVVREDAFLLYGFIDKQERALFRALIKVNGVGPKMAIAILSSITPEEFVQCIHRQDTLWLTKLPGIGKKTAERLVVEMKDSIQALAITANSSNTQQNFSLRVQDEAMSALEALGFKHQAVNSVISKIDDGQKTCEQLIREALQLL